MIRDFWVKNYLSICDKQELNFVAKGPASELVFEVAKDVFLYKLAILYGSNASGKSNMLKAMNEVFRLMVMPKSIASKKISGYIPFALSTNAPTEMHISFFAEGIRYDYYVAFNGNYILKEILNYYPKKAKSLFYERTFVNDKVQADIKFGQSLKLQAKTRESIRENTLNNHSVLSVCSKVAFKEDIAPFNVLINWIMLNCHEIDGDYRTSSTEILTKAYKDIKKRKFFNQILCKADLNILEYKPTVKYLKIPQKIREQINQGNMPDKIKESLLKKTIDSISFLNYSKKGNFEIPIEFQSKGTIKYIRILTTLYDMITSSHVYYLDELGEDLHYDLLFYYLNIFLFNSEESQLIITSQETTLLSQDLINDNRGVVWFVEKNKETAASEYSRGDSFGLHKNLSLYNSYHIGRLGAKPELGSVFIDLED